MSLDVRGTLAAAGYQLGTSGTQQMRESRNGWISICCVFHTENTPSLGINVSNGSYNCFGCGAHGGWGQLKEALGIAENADGSFKTGESNYSRMKRAAKGLGTHTKQVNKAHEFSEKVKGLHDLENNVSPSTGYEVAGKWMNDWEWDWRGMPKEFLSMFGAKHWSSHEIEQNGNEFIDVPRIYLPFKHPRYNFTIGYASRRLDDEEHRAQPKYRNASILPTTEILYLHSATVPNAPVVIVEGPVDALVLRYHGIPAVASLGTNQWSPFKTRLILSKRPTVVLALGDGDEAGRRFNWTLERAFKDIIGTDRLFKLDLPEGLDPGSFDGAWIQYLWTSLDEASKGGLSALRDSGLDKIPFFRPEMIAAA